MSRENLSMSLAEVADIPHSVMESRIVRHAFNAIRQGGDEALLRHLSHGHTLFGMDAFAKRVAFLAALSDQEKQRLASFDLGKQLGAINRVVIENDDSGNIVIMSETATGRHTAGQAVTVSSAKWAVAQQLAPSIPVHVSAQDAYLVAYQLGQASGTWSVMASSREEAEQALRNWLLLNEEDSLEAFAYPMWVGVGQLLANCLFSSVWQVRLASISMQEAWSIEVEANEGSIAGTFQLEADDRLRNLFLAMAKFGFALAGVQVVEAWEEAVPA